MIKERKLIKKNNFWSRVQAKLAYDDILLSEGEVRTVFPEVEVPQLKEIFEVAESKTISPELTLLGKINEIGEALAALEEQVVGENISLIIAKEEKIEEMEVRLFDLAREEIDTQEGMGELKETVSFLKEQIAAAKKRFINERRNLVEAEWEQQERQNREIVKEETEQINEVLAGDEQDAALKEERQALDQGWIEDEIEESAEVIFNDKLRLNIEETRTRESDSLILEEEGMAVWKEDSALGREEVFSVGKAGEEFADEKIREFEREKQLLRQEEESYRVLLNEAEEDEMVEQIQENLLLLDQKQAELALRREQYLKEAALNREAAMANMQEQEDAAERRRLEMLEMINQNEKGLSKEERPPEFLQAEIVKDQDKQEKETFSSIDKKQSELDLKREAYLQETALRIEAAKREKLTEEEENEKRCAAMAQARMLAIAKKEEALKEEENVYQQQLEEAEFEAQIEEIQGNLSLVAEKKEALAKVREKYLKEASLRRDAVMAERKIQEQEAVIREKERQAARQAKISKQENALREEESKCRQLLAEAKDEAQKQAAQVTLNLVVQKQAELARHREEYLLESEFRRKAAMEEREKEEKKAEKLKAMMAEARRAVIAQKEVEFKNATDIYTQALSSITSESQIAEVASKMKQVEQKKEALMAVREKYLLDRSSRREAALTVGQIEERQNERRRAEMAQARWDKIAEQKKLLQEEEASYGMAVMGNTESGPKEEIQEKLNKLEVKKQQLAEAREKYLEEAAGRREAALFEQEQKKLEVARKREQLAETRKGLMEKEEGQLCAEKEDAVLSGEAEFERALEELEEKKDDFSAIKMGIASGKAKEDEDLSLFENLSEPEIFEDFEEEDKELDAVFEKVDTASFFEQENQKGIDYGAAMISLMEKADQAKMQAQAEDMVEIERREKFLADQKKKREEARQKMALERAKLEQRQKELVEQRREAMAKNNPVKSQSVEKQDNAQDNAEEEARRKKLIEAQKKKREQARRKMELEKIEREKKIEKLRAQRKGE